MGILAKKKNHLAIMNFVPRFDGEGTEFAITDKKMIIGSSEHCDISIPDDHISYYHAMISIDRHGNARIIDLDSKNGIYINGSKVSNEFFAIGDTVRLGTYQFYVEETIANGQDELNDYDSNVNEITGDDTLVSYHDMPVMPGYVLVDNEPCFIEFHEEDFKAIDAYPMSKKFYENFEEYIYEVEEEKLEDIVVPNDEKSIEVTTMSKGSILNIQYLPVKDGDYFFTGGKVKKNNHAYLDTLNKKDIFPFLSISGSSLAIHPLEGYSLDRISENGNVKSFQNEQAIIEEDDIARYTFQTVQVFIKLVDNPPSLKSAKIFEKDPEFNKQLLRVASVYFLIMLILLGYKVEDIADKPVKELAVVYRKIQKKPILDKNIKEVKMDNKKNESNKAVKTVKSKGKPAPKTVQKQVVKNNEIKPKPQKQKAVQKITKIKRKIDTYKSNFSNSMSKLFAKSGAINNKNTKSLNLDSTASAIDTSVKSSKSSPKQARFEGNIGDLGDNPNIKMDSSYGAKGLMNKKGIATSIASTKTVVMGSMDPNVLRKILQEYLPQFKHCYQQELELNNDRVKGVVDLQFQINKRGRATKIDVKSKKSRFSNQGRNCMAKVLALIQFPRPKGGGVVDVRQPLNFYQEKN